MQATVYPSGGEPVEAPLLVSPIAFTWYCSLKDSSHQQAFDNYRLNEGSVVRQWILLALFLSAAAIKVSEWDFRNSAFVAVQIASALPLFLTGVYAVLTSQKRFGWRLPIKISARHVGDLIILSRLISTGFRIIDLSRTGPCTGDLNEFSADCNSLHELHQLPALPVIQLYATSLIVPIIYRCHSSWVNLACVVGTFGVMCTALTFVKSSAPMYNACGSVMLATAIGMLDFEYSMAHSFTAYCNLELVAREKAIAESEKQIIAENAKDLRHFIGNVAHDLKTPLQAFVSELDCLESSEGVLTRSARNSLQSLKSTCHYMTMTINRYLSCNHTNHIMLNNRVRSLDYVKSTSGFKLKPKEETVDIDQCFEWVRTCIQQYSRVNMHMTLDKLDHSVCRHVITDKQWLMENLLCLASNSVKYIGDGGEVRFRVAVESPENRLASEDQIESLLAPSLLFEVEDDGVGIPDDKMALLFQPFRQAQRNAGGTGLGLFALANRVTAIGGQYGVRRRRDLSSGVLFWFTIPFRPDYSVAELIEQKGKTVDHFVLMEMGESKNTPHSISDVDNKALQSLPTDLSSDIPMRSCKKQILVVDDSIMIQKAATHMLRNLGHLVDTANHGVECLQRLREKRYDLVLMDINMPVMDGLETIQRIRADEAAMCIKEQLSVGARRQLVIGVSADSDSETRETALLSGMDDFLDKPLDIRSLKTRCLQYDVVL